MGKLGVAKLGRGEEMGLFKKHHAGLWMEKRSTGHVCYACIIQLLFEDHSIFRPFICVSTRFLGCVTKAKAPA